jgi:energy-coupling factor transporter transmembrane protein EcfT
VSHQAKSVTVAGSMMHALLVFVGEAGGSQSWSGLGCGVVVFGLLLLVIGFVFFFSKYFFQRANRMFGNKF